MTIEKLELLEDWTKDYFNLSEEEFEEYRDFLNHNIGFYPNFFEEEL